VFAMEDSVYKGKLTVSEGTTCLLGQDGTKYLHGETIWSGYVRHWSGRNVCARRLPQRDYETGQPIIILWPDEPVSDEPAVEIYLNERLVKYAVSFLGHIAVNVNGQIFNFSHLINENEVLQSEEYFYRPALGEFAPHPVTGRDNTDDPGNPYYDKFGRLFMRTVHVLKITGLDTLKLSEIFQRKLDSIRHAPVSPRKPGHYAGFNPFTNNCATITRDGFQEYGLQHIRGIFPRDLFVNLSYFFLKQVSHSSVKTTCQTLQQLKVPEAPASIMPPLINPLNRVKYRRLSGACPAFRSRPG